MKGQGYYEKELPDVFKTWVEFYQYTKKNNLHTGHKEITYFKPQKVELKAEDTAYPKEVNTKREVIYLASYIKENALDELLSEEFTREEVVEFLEKARHALWWNNIYKYDNVQAKITRALFTILGIKNYDKHRD